MANTLTATYSISTVDDISGETCENAWTDSFIYTQRVCLDLVYAAPVVDDVIDMGTITSAKAIFVESVTGGDVVSVKLQGNAVALPMKDGSGGLAWVNRDGGVTGLSVSCTAACTARVVIYA